MDNQKTELMYDISLLGIFDDFEELLEDIDEIEEDYLLEGYEDSAY